MMETIAQIKRFLAAKYDLLLVDADNIGMIRVDGIVPDSEHMIPLGVKQTPMKVRIKDDRIYIDPQD